MRWYHKLYIGKTARSKRYKIVWKVKHHAGMLGVYLITLSSNNENLLDIFDSSLILQPHYKREDMFIVGIACGYDEAVEVATQIIDELYRNTGDFDIRQYLTN
jgi:lipoprotein NlpI